MKIISLGADCFPKVMLVKYGYVKRRRDGGKSFPFDLARHYSDQIISIIDNDFEGYLDADELFVNDNKVIQNRRYGCYFSHESCDNRLEQFTTDNFEPFICRYSNRLLNFRAALEGTNEVVFVMRYWKGLSVNLPKLEDSIHLRYPRLEFKILCIHTPPPGDEPEDTESGRWVHKCIPLPWEGYVFWKDLDLSFERRVCLFLSEHLPVVSPEVLGGFDEEQLPIPRTWGLSDWLTWGKTMAWRWMKRKFFKVFIYKYIQ